ncbi:hypothetical protein T484DRAFT_1753278 [Baffinella frigidus]|nr:hypothetical protein T484DRAFT_1753278 [Cryptophyta sp. CCMP2293]
MGVVVAATAPVVSSAVVFVVFVAFVSLVAFVAFVLLAATPLPHPAVRGRLYGPVKLAARPRARRCPDSHSDAPPRRDSVTFPPSQLVSFAGCSGARAGGWHPAPLGSYEQDPRRVPWYERGEGHTQEKDARETDEHRSPRESTRAKPSSAAPPSTSPRRH